MSNAFTEAIELNKAEMHECSKIKHVHIGVFFDGTGNNMVQQAHYETFKKNFSDPNSEFASDEQKTSYNDIKILKEDAEKSDRQLKTVQALEQNSSPLGAFLMQEKRRVVLGAIMQERDEKYHELEKKQIEAHIDTEAMAEDKVNPYSNVAILHSALKKHPNTKDSIFYNIYVEGSGAGNLADMELDLIQQMVNSGGGLGFGVGIKGVTSLVAKACDYIYRYLSTVQGSLDENTKYHFYIFGFSRGSTCSRLFAQLITRNPGTSLKCEKEMLKYTKVCKRGNRLAFMERNFLTNKDSGEGVIKRENVYVEFLGIYDTVASIGILNQQDGIVNSLRDSLKSVKSTKEWVCHYNSDDDNYHYNNASEYGLFINTNEQMKNVFHIGAADEYRENFAFVNIGNAIKKGAEIIIPGCHSDVGGSYVDYSGNIERVLYRFRPRYVNQAKRDYVPSEEESNSNDNPQWLVTVTTGWKSIKEIQAKRDYVPSEEESNSIGFKNPLSPEEFLPLDAYGLGKIGWIDKYYDNNNENFRQYLDEDCKKPCTIRFVPPETKEGGNRCVKFSHDAKGYYSNIPLKMMLIRCESKVEKVIGGLFEDELIDSFFVIPKDLEDFGEKLVSEAKEIGNEERKWITAGNDFFSEDYRKLRLKYLHFTASCQIKNERAKSSGGTEMDWTNFGNECNYTSEGKICRIMYDGTNEKPASPEVGVKYLEIKSGDINFTHQGISVSPQLYTKE